MIIRVVGVSVTYGSIKALENVSLEVFPGEVVSIIGPNGSGKTTLLKTIDSIVKPIAGSIYIDGKNIYNYTRREIAKILSYVPQRIDLLQNTTVIDFVLTGRRPYADFSYSKVDIDKVFEVLKIVNAEHLAYRKLDELSGGELQRIVIARALASEPKVLLLDEPTANLDPKYQVEIMKLIRRLSSEKKVAVIMAIHDLTSAYRFSDKVVMVKNGVVVSIGKPEDVITEDNIWRVFEVKTKIFRELRTIIVEI